MSDVSLLGEISLPSYAESKGINLIRISADIHRQNIVLYYEQWEYCVLVVLKTPPIHFFVNTNDSDNAPLTGNFVNSTNNPSNSN